MPCWSIIEIKLGQNYDLATLEAALKRMGHKPVRTGDGKGLRFEAGYYRDGVLRIEDGRGQAEADKLAADIRKGYTREGIALAARRQGLKVDYDKRDAAKLYITTDGRNL